MQTSRFVLAAGFFFVATLAAPFAFAQGSLLPPGPPAPVMKTLDQVEPRIPLVTGSPGVDVNAEGGITITESGSYYLTKNLTVWNGDGITISANDVTVDLSGFTVRSHAGTSNGWAITTGSSVLTQLDSLGSVVVKNGFLAPPYGVPDSNYGFSQGLNILGTVEDIVVDDSTLANAIQAKIVRRCSVKGATFTAISAMDVSDCVVSSFGLVGIQATGRISGCTVNDSGVTGAATAISGQLVQDSIARIATVVGSPGRQIRGIQATVAKNCFVSGPASTGIEASLAVGCWTTGVTANQIANKADMP